MKIRPLIPALALSFALVLPCFAPAPVRADLSKTATQEKAGGFTYRPPMGWEVANVSASKYKVVLAPIEQGMTFRPNLNFVLTNEKIGLDVYAATNIAAIEKELHGKQLAKSRFKTASGLQGYRVTFETSQNNVDLRQTFYLFAGKPSRKLIITATSLASDGDQYDAAFDECVKSLKFG